MEQRAKQLACWIEPFVQLRIPHMFNLRRDPFERALENSNTYFDWLMSHAFLLYEMQAIVARPDPGVRAIPAASEACRRSTSRASWRSWTLPPPATTESGGSRPRRIGSPAAIMAHRGADERWAARDREWTTRRYGITCRLTARTRCVRSTTGIRIPGRSRASTTTRSGGRTTADAGWSSTSHGPREPSRRSTRSWSPAAAPHRQPSTRCDGPPRGWWASTSVRPASA